MPIRGHGAGDGDDGVRGEALGGASSVLLLDGGDGAASSFLPAEPERVSLLALAYESGPDEVLERWRRETGAPPERWAVVDVGGGVRGAVDVDGETTAVGPPRVVDAVDSPGDLSGTAIALNRHLEAWGDGETLLTVDALSVLLDTLDQERVFRLLHVLNARAASVGAVVHYRLDPEAIDERTLRTLEPVFDVVVRPDGTERRAGP